MTNTAERAHYYSETEVCRLGSGTQFGLNPVQREADLVLIIFKVNQTIGVRESGTHTFIGR